MYMGKNWYSKGGFLDKYIKYTLEELVTQLKQFNKKNSSYNLTITNSTFGLKEKNMTAVKPPKWFQWWSENVYAKDMAEIKKDIVELKQDVAELKQDVSELKVRVSVIEERLERNNIR